jgi:hypothetical protein
MNDLSGTVNLLESAQDAAGKNIILNSDFSCWQRGTTLTPGGTFDKTFLADRFWMFRSTAGNGTASRQTTTAPQGFQYYFRFQRTAATTTTNPFGIYQDIETANSIGFAGKTVTLSFYARKGANYSATSDNLNVKLLSGTGTDQSMYAGFTGSLNLIDSNAVLTTSWQRFSFSVAVGSTATELGVQFLYTPTGTAGAADLFDITGIQLEAASSASLFQTATGNQGSELAACQRYYWRASVPSTSQSILAMGRAYNTTLMENTVSLPVPMRIYPATLDYANISMTASGTTHTSGTWTLRNYGDTNQVYIEYVHGSGVFTAGQIWFLATQATLAGYIGLSAEL